MWNEIAVHQEDIKIARGPPPTCIFMTRLYRRVDFPIEFLCGGAHIPGSEAGSASAKHKNKPGMTAVTALFVDHIKLVMLFVLIGSLIGLSRAGRKSAGGSHALTANIDL